MIRHPSYLGLLLLTSGLIFVFVNIIGIIVVIPIISMVLSRRIKEEERYMEEIIGKRYISWKNKRYKIFPYIY